MQEPVKYLLRWVFVYSDHKPIKRGLWSYPGDHNADFAWAQSKENLLVAYVEGKDIQTKELVRLAECPGCDFVNFSWIRMSVTKNIAIKGSQVLPGREIGMMLTTRDRQIKIYDTGYVESEAHNLDYGKIHLAGFGR